MCGAEDGSTVLHHIRTGHLGIGKKPKDHRGIDLCSKCHTYVHGDGIHDYDKGGTDRVLATGGQVARGGAFK